MRPTKSDQTSDFAGFAAEHVGVVEPKPTIRGCGRSYKGYVIGSAPPSTPLDDVVFSYTGLWEVSQVLQSSRGNTGGASPYARTVSYAYDTQPVSGGNYSRLQTLTYPDGATQGFKYGASSSTPDSRISRATQLDLGSTALVGYGYIGLGTMAVTDYKVPGIQLDRNRAPSGATAVGSYPGLDKLGRVLRQMWVDSGFTTGSGGKPDRPPVVSTLYAYTKSSDRTQAVDDRPGAAQPISQGYEYDDLHRLVEARRGVWNGTSVPTGAGSQRWRDDANNVTLDALGNWRFSWTDLDGSGSYSDATERDDRTHDIFNRIVGHVLKGQGSGGSDLNLGDLTYDRASNLASWKVQSGSSPTAVTAKHDAWNRLTEVSFGGTLRCRQAHNALHWRSFQLSDRTGAGAAPDGTMDQARLMSYGADWRLLEERVDDNLSLSAWTEGTWSPSTDLDRVQQYVWGTRYVDDIVLHRVDKNMDGDYSDPGDGTWHHLTDAQFSSVCLIDKAFAVAERVTYSAYGVATHIPMADLNCDGAVNGADIPALLTAFGSIGSSPYQSPADLNRDGMVNSADLAMLLGDFQAAQPDGALSRPNVDNPIGWDGYVFDRESGLYTVRFRTYETGLGRWIERDPAGYEPAAASMYEAFSSSASNLSDSAGLRNHAAGSSGAIVIRHKETLSQHMAIEPRSMKPADHGWNSEFNVTMSPGSCELRIDVNIEVNDPFNQLSAVTLSYWKTAILECWGPENRGGTPVGRFKACCDNPRICRNGIQILINVEFSVGPKKDDPNWRHHVVRPVDPGATAPPHFRAGETTSMTDWSQFQNREICHEFGHMLGNIDEYGGVVGDPSMAPGQLPGIMGDQSQPVMPRNMRAIVPYAERLNGCGKCKAVNAADPCPSTRKAG